MPFYDPDPPLRRVLASEGAVVDAVIDQAANTITDVIDLGYKRLAAIQMPAAWDAAGLTFQASHDGVTWGDLHYGDSGNELSTVVNTDRVIVLNTDDFAGLRYIKIRSGTSALPVGQAAARTLKLLATQ